MILIGLNPLADFSLSASTEQIEKINILHHLPN